ncbi:proline-rich receptor-like protein kinase PERK4 [Brachypodium distachyon]|uniref:non-specific serine/threonine protein kinase n=1 Tax=Brachypodium distachyon TaxID=15368 RepID=I1H3X4_BRADI|nr:proline-rich receptor-like protein kinase PERK4 [Brachypodium distachyon]KQK20993.1 hypothetical protein BRADI_1g58020v3 [Brachypodium distachyon]|eukprot:XP_010230088.2 proline-rich receptor-like protein kinase PERK4 [Brachypodium distachyon]
MASSDSSPPSTTPILATRASRRLSSSHKSSYGGLKLKPEQVALAGVGAALLLVAASCCFCCCRSKKKKSSSRPPPPYLDPAMRFYADTSGFKGDTTASYSPTPPHQWRVAPAPASPDTDSTAFSKSRLPPAMPPPPPVPAGAEKSAFSYADLAAATGGFSEANLLGQGGFGYVHRGELLLPSVTGKKKKKEKVAVAVKQLKAGSGQGEREFQAEVDMISRVHHRHLVSLLGYCIAGHHRLLVYAFVPNHTLEHHLHSASPPVDWPTRLRIAIGAAKGIAYLHEDCNPRIIHRDIKSANILLDDDFEAKVADFGLAKLSHGTETHVSTRVMGTFGYLAPEYALTGKLTEKSDVFSYGVMLLELLTGRRPSDRCHDGNGDDDDDNLVDWARPALARAQADGGYGALVDRRLRVEYDAAEAARVAACAAACVRHAGRRRPKMSLVVKALQGHVPLEALNVDAARGDTLSSVGSMPEFGNGGGYRRLGSGSGSSSTTASSTSSSSNYTAQMERIRNKAVAQPSPD